MENKNKIYEKLQKLQKEINVPKNQYNGHGKYKYRSAEDILSSLKELLDKNECTIILEDQIKVIGERYYVEATATLSHKKDFITVKSYAREPESRSGMMESQITGAASSYARKYALNGLFAIDDTKDEDFLNNSPEFTEKKQKERPVNRIPKSVKENTKMIEVNGNPNLITEKQLKKIMWMVSAQGITDIEVDLKDQFNKVKPEELTKKEASLFIDYLDSYSARNY